MKTITLTPKDTKGLDLAGMPCKSSGGKDVTLIGVFGTVFTVIEGTAPLPIWTISIQVEEQVFIDYALRSLMVIIPDFNIASCDYVSDDEWCMVLTHNSSEVYAVKSHYYAKKNPRLNILAKAMGNKTFRFADGRFEVVV